jgi:predicted MFS family arabinose efflux permease
MLPSQAIGGLSDFHYFLSLFGKRDAAAWRRMHVSIEEIADVQDKKLIPLAVALLMFPQLAQTLYSPALADFAARFAVPPQAAAQTMTVYFLAFAFGVVGWGRLCDRAGRRRAMLGGLAVYAAGSVLALCTPTFAGLLLAQAVAAFGAAAGSVVTQTVLRDRYGGPALAKVFSQVTLVLALSPALGLFAGAALVHAFGYRGVLWCLLGLAAALLAWSAWSLPETRPVHAKQAPVLETLRMLAMDVHVWRSALLVAVFNVAMCSYYALGPFLFRRLGLGEAMYGSSGLLLAFGASLGAWINRRLISAGVRSERLLALGVMLALGGGIGVQLTQATAWFVLPMMLVVLAFGLAIPHVLGQALAAFGDRLGTAGALFGLMYYLMIGAGLWLAGWTQALGASLLVCGYVAAWLLLAGLPKARTA